MKILSFENVDIVPHSFLACRVSAERSALGLMGFPLCIPTFLSGYPIIFSFISNLVNQRLCALGLLFSRSIFEVFGAFPEFEFWPVLLCQISSPG